MRSPFPGTDPYPEQYWGDIHHRIITYSCDTIQKLLPGELVARVDKRVFVEPAEESPRNIIPDVRVVERGRRGSHGLRTGNGIAVAEPLVVHLQPDEPVRQGYIEILDSQVGPPRRHGDRDPEPVEQETAAQGENSTSRSRKSSATVKSAWSRSTCCDPAAGSCRFPSIGSPKATTAPTQRVPARLAPVPGGVLPAAPPASDSRRSPSRCGRMTPTSRLTSRPCSTSAMKQDAMRMISTMASSLTRRWSPKTPSGPTDSSASRGAGSLLTAKRPTTRRQNARDVAPGRGLEDGIHLALFLRRHEPIGQQQPSSPDGWRRVRWED